jgi:protein-S-isoprenylcysteine O-methyltransferase Ste14
MRELSNRLPRFNWFTVGAYSVIFVTVPILTLLVGRFLDNLLVFPEFPPFPINLLAGFTIFLFGLAVGIKSTRILYYKGRGLPWGEVKKRDQSTHLVTTGLYASCRHPMTFGYSLLPCGMGVLLKSLSMTFVIPAFIFSVMIVWLKVREEPNLERRFGQAYRNYKRQAPFLIPRFKPLIVDLATPLLRRTTEAEETSP